MEEIVDHEKLQLREDEALYIHPDQYGSISQLHTVTLTTGHGWGLRALGRGGSKGGLGGRLRATGLGTLDLMPVYSSPDQWHLSSVARRGRGRERT